MSTYAIEIDGLTKSYDGNVHALGGVDIKIKKGEFFGIERLLGCLHNPENRLDDIRFALEDFMGDENPHDDVTLALVDMPAHDSTGMEKQSKMYWSNINHVMVPWEHCNG